MRVDQFDFDLPDHLIADHPVEPRDAARMLVVRGDGRFEDRVFGDLTGYLSAGDVLVVNDTRVFPARLSGKKGDGKVEVTLTRANADGTWQALARPARKLKAGVSIAFADGFSADVTAKGEGGAVTLLFATGDADLMTLLDRHGIMPLPPYIDRKAGPENRDRQDYQTVYAVQTGAVAAPTAGLHFTEDLLARIETMGVRVVRITLHVGIGTFMPIKTDDTDDHVMHAEWGEISKAAAASINDARRQGGRVFAVGTTSVRLLESAANDVGDVNPFSGDTDLFLVPGSRFKVVDRMITNFHLPRSTLFMLVSAFSGTARMKAAYAHAVAAGYRFYSYGDACLLERQPSPDGAL
ncbi:MAG: tRNA preQ1(34) S-adenosylmethionine ribosyltransferase-isomerase QueA [Pseudomonadota bacterium]